jgi:thiol-disulfide isomerase/thioredoxin
MLRRLFLVAILSLFLAPFANAASPVPYDDAAFKAAQGAGKSILVQIHADWCPQCAAQRPIIANLIKTDKFKDLVIFNVDFDTQKDLVRKFNAQRQSTLIVFKGANEVDRSVGATQAGPITDLLTKAM